jgi:hypothetical protein
MLSEVTARLLPPDSALMRPPRACEHMHVVPGQHRGLRNIVAERLRGNIP